VILLDHVVQKSGPDCLHFGWAAKPHGYPVLFSITGCMGAALVDCDLS
jgi:hypothetical protein